jgi:hypothetical protein
LLTLILALSWAALINWITQMGIFLGALTTTLLALIALVNKTGLARPAKWLWKRLVGEPHTEYLRRVFDEQLEPIKAELQTNGGTSLKDAVIRTEGKVDQLQSEVDLLKTERRFR